MGAAARRRRVVAAPLQRDPRAPNRPTPSARRTARRPRHLAAAAGRSSGRSSTSAAADGELKQVAMAFIRLDDTDALLAAGGPDAVARRGWTTITDSSTRPPQATGVCWLETQAEANSVRWTLDRRSADRDRARRRASAPRRPRDRRRVSGCRCGSAPTSASSSSATWDTHERCTYIVMGDATNLAARLMIQGRAGRDPRRASGSTTSCAGTFESTALEPFDREGQEAAGAGAYVVGRAGDGRGDRRSRRPGIDEGDIIGRAAETRRPARRHRRRWRGRARRRGRHRQDPALARGAGVDGGDPPVGRSCGPSPMRPPRPMRRSRRFLRRGGRDRRRRQRRRRRPHA